MRLVLLLAAWLLVSTSPAAVAQQYSITQVPGLLMCSERNLSECFAGREAALLRQFPGIVRHGADGTTSVKLLNGKWALIKNSPGQEWPDCWEALDMQKGDRYLTLGCVAEEADWWKLLDRKTGAINDFSGYPYLSPDARHIAVANQDEMNGSVFQMYGFKVGIASLMLDALGKDVDSWWPDNICWVDNTTLIYRHSTWAEQTRASKDALKLEHLKLKDGRWRIASGHPADLATCSQFVS